MMKYIKRGNPSDAKLSSVNPENISVQWVFLHGKGYNMCLEDQETDTREDDIWDDS